MPVLVKGGDVLLKKKPSSLHKKTASPCGEAVFL